MILFLEDWKKYPTAIVHTSTKNRSWVRLAHLYKQMGIRNHAFPLALINPELEDIDPHDPLLTREQILAIGFEISINPWYYFREVAKVPAQSGITTNPVEANRGNIALWWYFFNHVTVFLIQIRQTGKSFSTDLLTSLLLNVLCKNTKINLLTKDDKLRRENIGRIKDIMGALPYYLQLQTRSDADNGEEITVNVNGNHFKTHLPQMNKQRALNAGRGMTTPIFLVDEGPFQPNIDLSIQAALPAMSAAIEAAKENKEPYGVIMTTTAGELSTPSGAYMYNLISGSKEHTETHFDAKDQEELHAIVKAGSRNERLAVNVTLNHRQMGKTDEWLRERMKDALAEGDNAERDFLNKWTSSSDRSPFKPEVSEAIAASQSEPLYVDVDPVTKFSIYWYVTVEELERVRKERDILLGLDSAEGSGGDYMGLIITDVRTGMTLGRGNMNSISVHRFTEFIADLLIKFPRSTLVPENKNMGVAIIDGLLQLLPSYGIDPFKRIFNWIVQDQITHKEKFSYIRRGLSGRDKDIYHLWKKYFGYTTAGSGPQSRDNLFGMPLVLGTGRFANVIRDSMLIKQLLGLERRNGRIDHEVDGNDDLVIAWLLNFWFMTQGTNLGYYGIDPITVMSEVRERKEESPLERHTRIEQEQLRKRIEELLEALGNETDMFVSARYEHELRSLDARLIKDRNDVYSMEDLIRKARDNGKARTFKSDHTTEGHRLMESLLNAMRS